MLIKINTMTRIFASFISLLLLLTVVSGQEGASVNRGKAPDAAAAPQKQEEEKDTVVRYKRMRGFRLGLDFSRVGASFIYADRMELGVVSDFEVKDRWYWVGELGLAQVDVFKAGWSYAGSGLYIKSGMNYNFLQPDNPDYHDAATIGFRLAGSTFSQQMSNISLGDGYWGTSVLEHIPSKGVSAYWLEAVVGAKAELSKNVFIGGDIGLRFKISDSSKEVTPYYIPGFGKGGKSLSPAFSYYVLYLFPPTDPAARATQKKKLQQQKEQARKKEADLKAQDKAIREQRKEERNLLRMEKRGIVPLPEAPADSVPAAPKTAPPASRTAPPAAR